MIKEIRLERFRSFKELKLTGFSRLNVFIGKNNLGKSTLLEALYLAAEGKDIIHPSPVWHIMKRRGLSSRIRNASSDEMLQYLKDHFFYLKSSNSCIEIETDKRFRSLKFNFKEYEELLKVEEFVKHYHGISPSSKRYLLKLAEKRKFYVLASIEENEAPVLLILENGQAKEFRIVYLTANYISENLKFFLDTCLLCESARNISQIVKKLEPELREGVYTSLKTLLSGYFEAGIRSIEPSFSDLYVNTDSNRIPFSMLGDGLRYFTLHYLVLNLQKPSYVFFEEPENYMHPKMMNSLVEAMLKSKHQVFIVTHNLEFLQKLLWKAKVSEENLKVFGFYGLSHGIPEIETYDLKQAYINFNKLEIDLNEKN